jgi:hypothetical protein
MKLIIFLLILLTGCGGMELAEEETELLCHPKLECTILEKAPKKPVELKLNKVYVTQPINDLQAYTMTAYYRETYTWWATTRFVRSNIKEPKKSVVDKNEITTPEIPIPDFTEGQARVDAFLKEEEGIDEETAKEMQEPKDDNDILRTIVRSEPPEIEYTCTDRYYQQPNECSHTGTPINPYDNIPSGYSACLIDPHCSLYCAATVPGDPRWGDHWEKLFVLSENDSGSLIWKPIRAVKIGETAGAVFFVQQGYEAYITPYIEQYKANTQNIIIPILKEKFAPWGDVDKNDKVFIVFSGELSKIGALGYYRPEDRAKRGFDVSKNGADMVVITTQTDFSHGNIVDLISGTIAHEIQHMINQNSGLYKETWLNEAMSQAAEYYTGFVDNHNAWIYNHFLPGGWRQLSLTSWTSKNYGYGAIFMRYLLDQYGEEIIKKIYKSNLSTWDAVEQAAGEEFNEIFHNFSHALMLSGTNRSDNPKHHFSILTEETKELGRLKPVVVSTNQYYFKPTRLGEDPDHIITGHHDSYVPTHYDPYYDPGNYAITYVKWDGKVNTIRNGGSGLNIFMFKLLNIPEYPRTTTSYLYMFKKGTYE